MQAQNVNLVFRQFAKIDRGIRDYVSPSNNLTFEDLCLRYPDTSAGGGVFSDCVTYGVLAIFLDRDLAELTDKVVQEVVTALYRLQPALVNQFVSGIAFSGNGSVITGASAVMNIWLLADNSSNPWTDANEDAEEWELGFIEATIDQPPENPPPGLQVYSLAERSYDDEIMSVVYSNFGMLIIGFALLFIYIIVVLGEMNWIEQRALLSIAGMVVIGLSLGASLGLGFYLNISFNDMCPVIPFLLLGIGVDDMFVIVQCLDNLDKVEGESSEERVSKAMKHAGVSILVTSITDAVTFFIGSTSVKYLNYIVQMKSLVVFVLNQSMPILRGFCYFCGLGVIFLFLFASTFFVACLLLDEKRKERQKAARPGWSPPGWTRARPGKYIFKHWVSPLVVWRPAVVLILAAAVALAGAGVYGLFNIESEYDSIEYMRHESYPYKYFKALGKYFRGSGERVDVYIGEVIYFNNQ